MNRWPLVLYLILLLDSALGFLPAPVGVYVDSVNFHHVLHWKPGPGTPVGTHYKIFRKERKKWKHFGNSFTTSLQLNLPNNNDKYSFMVRAVHNKTWSPESDTVHFYPYRDTRISRPELSLAGCGNCINISISLPEAGIDDIHTFYYPDYKIVYKKRDGEETSIKTQERNFTLKNLQNGTEYCVQVQPKISLNKNTVPSAWECVFTSRVEPNRGPVIWGSVAALMILVGGGLTACMYSLNYTGFICKLKAPLPRALTMVRGLGHALTSELTIPNQISIGPEVDKHRKNNHPRTPRSAATGSDLEEEDDEEDEVEAINVYVDNPLKRALGNGPCGDSGDGSGTPSEEERDLNAARDKPDEAETEGAAGLCLPDEGQAEVGPDLRDEEEEEEEEVVVWDSSGGNIDMFSITVAALDEGEEEEQSDGYSLTDLLTLSDVEPLLPTDPRRTWSCTDAQTGSHYRPTLTGPEDHSRPADMWSDAETQDEEEEEEEEEELSSYMRHT